MICTAALYDVACMSDKRIVEYKALQKGADWLDKQAKAAFEYRISLLANNSTKRVDKTPKPKPRKRSQSTRAWWHLF